MLTPQQCVFAKTVSTGNGGVPLRGAIGRVVTWRFRDGGQHRGLCQRQILGAGIEVIAGCYFYSVLNTTVWSSIEITSQDILLGVLAFQLDGEDQLFDFTGNCAVIGPLFVELNKLL